MGVDAREFPGGLLRLDPAFAYAELPSSWPLPWAEFLTLAPGIHGRRSLEGCSPWHRWESDMTARLHFHFSLSFIGEGNGNPLQCSCLENPRDGGVWWAMGSHRVGHDWSDLAVATVIWLAWFLYIWDFFSCCLHKTT